MKTETIVKDFFEDVSLPEVSANIIQVLNALSQKPDFCVLADYTRKELIFELNRIHSLIICLHTSALINDSEHKDTSR